MPFSYQSKFRQATVATLFCCTILVASVCADELKLRDGLVIQADQIWESSGQVWFRQGQTVRSIPKSEVVAYGAKLTSNESAKNQKLSGDAKAKRLAHSPAPLPTTQPILTPTVSENAPPVTRIIFKDGTQIDVDTSWEIGNKVGYRLGTMQSFIDKETIQRVLKNYAPTHAEAPEKVSTGSLPYSTGSTILDQLITSNATRHNLDPLLIYFVMRQESSFKIRAVSRVGARGLMQLMPATARQLGVRNIDDPSENIEAGARHLKYLLNRYQGDVNLVLAAYNAGEEAVARYGNRVPPYRETQNYVRNIGWAYYKARQ